MLKKEITYEDFEGKPVTETFYFNMTKTELVELEASYQKGLIETMEEFLKKNDRNSIIQTFKKIIMITYGKKADDGSNRFIKSDELSLEFSQTPAYDVLFMELATDDKAGSEFILKVLPKDLAGEVEKEISLREAKEKAEAAHDARVASASAITDAEPNTEGNVVESPPTPSP